MNGRAELRDDDGHLLGKARASFPNMWVDGAAGNIIIEPIPISKDGIATELWLIRDDNHERLYRTA